MNNSEFCDRIDNKKERIVCECMNQCLFEKYRHKLGTVGVHGVYGKLDHWQKNCWQTCLGEQIMTKSDRKYAQVLHTEAIKAGLPSIFSGTRGN